MNDEIELANIRARDAECAALWFTEIMSSSFTAQAVRDRHTLLRLLDEIEAKEHARLLDEINKIHDEGKTP